MSSTTQKNIILVPVDFSEASEIAIECAIELAKVDPPAALAMADRITNYEEYCIYALRGVLRAWAGQDPAAARAVLEGRPEQEFRKTFPRDLAAEKPHRL